MAKNIVLCIDGTGNEYGNCNSNVVKLFAALEHNDPNQFTYYHPGLGTMGAHGALTQFSEWWTRVAGMAFGYGMKDTLADCYSVLMEHYEPGDKIFLYGFSRGAYCARALASMLHLYGLLRLGSDALIPYVVRMLTGKHGDDTWKIAARFKYTFSRKVEIEFLGVWDTVSSVGWAYNSLTVPHTKSNPSVRMVRHAVSIDERREAFRQNLFQVGVKNQDLKELWFAGVHSDVGGGYPEQDSGLAKLALEWMLDQSESAGLIVCSSRKSEMLGANGSEMSKPDATALMHTSLKSWWRFLEYIPRPHYDMKAEPPRKRWIIPLGRTRDIPADAGLHASVEERMLREPLYRPVNLAASEFGSRSSRIASTRS